KNRKQTYKCELRKKYSYKRKFRIREKRPIDLISEAIKDSFPKSAGITPVKALVAVILLVIAFLAVNFILSASFQAPPAAGGNVTYVSPALNTTLLGSGIASSGGLVKRMNSAYYELAISSSGADALKVRTSTYSGRVPNQVFILNSRMEQATTYQQFKFLLKKRLAEKGLPLNEINLAQLDTLPSGSLLIVPSGLIPEKMTAPGGANLLSLVQRGVVVLYIGQQFDQNGFSIPESGPNRGVRPDFASKLPFIFESANLNPGTQLNLKSGMYKVRASSNEALLYGAVSKIGAQSGTGAVIFVPQMLDPGWESKPDLAAQDVEKIIAEMLWTSPQASVEAAPPISNGTARSFFLSTPFEGQEKTVVSRVIASNKEGGVSERLMMLYLASEVKGSLYYREDYTAAVSGKVTESDTMMVGTLNETSQQEKRLFMSVTDVNGTQVELDPLAEGSQKIPLSGPPRQFPAKLRLDEGIYLASIVDESGTPYARMALEVIGINLVSTQSDFGKSIFNFSALSTQGQSIVVKRTKVTVDDRFTYYFRDTGSFGINMKPDLRDEQLAPGKHKFVFEFGEYMKEVQVERYVSTQFWENPIYWFMGALALLLVGGSPYIARLLQKEEFALDIPDFPPLSSMKIPVKKDTIFGIMARVNEDYRWKNTPLTLEEIKKGFKRIIYQDKPIFISDYNLEYILETLISKGSVKSALNYYGLSSWEEETGRTIKHLAMQRKIRDICINEAIPFSKSDDKVQCDMYLKVIGQDVFVYLMDSVEAREEKLALALKAMQKGLVILLFENAEEKKDFEDTINSASEGGGLVKLEIMSGSIVPLA
ncbi:MAG: hypothetical protein WC488_02870, partial [Candidatus Micrarchaeia archaeon]